ncbi:bifunctional biotin--[acetyl-CoA-carboxylase] ligase/biotin operon repressor BirA [Aliikangiella sp. IMCC44653]
MKQSTIEKIDALLHRLADGKFHSGQTLATELGISRTAVWKMLQTIQSWEVPVYSITGRGYQVPGGLNLLCASQVEQSRERVLGASSQLLPRLKVLTSVSSTADYLAQHWQSHLGGLVCIAEHQSQGRGRKGRPWISPFAANLYFSMGFRVPLGLGALGGLSLVVGMSLAETINQIIGETENQSAHGNTQNQVKLKWPNDILFEQRKLAGILVEASGESQDASFLNIGVGINWNMQSEQAKSVDQPWVNLSELTQKRIPRSVVLGRLLARLEQSLNHYFSEGFQEFAQRWESISALYRQNVVIHTARESVCGVEDGIEANGALRVKVGTKTHTFHSGEVSLRKN